MSLAPVVSPYMPFNGLTGLGLNSGALYIGLDGQDPQAYPQACYWDAAGAVLAAQPIDIQGGYPMYLGSPTRLYTASTFSIRVRDRSGVQVFYEAHAVPAPTVANGVFLTFAAAVAAFIPAGVQATGLNILGYNAPNDGGGANYIYAPIQAAGAGKFQSADGAWWLLVADIIYPEMFGAFGLAPDDTALARFFAMLPGHIGIVSKAHTITAKANIALTNCELRFINGAKITGSFGYELVEWTDLTRSICVRPHLENLYANAANSGTASVKSTDGCPILDMHFVSPRFTVPNAAVAALTFFIRSNAGSVANTCKGLYLHDPTFESCGKIALTIMNRGAAADRYTAVRDVHILRPVFKDLGLVHATDGFAISLDGWGSDFEITWPDVTNAKGIVIENTGWINGVIEHTRLRSLAAGCRPFSFTPYDVAFPMSKVRMVDNLCEDTPTDGSLFRGLNDSYFEANDLKSSANQAANFDGCNDLFFLKDKYTSAGGSCVFVTPGVGGSARLKWLECGTVYTGVAGSLSGWSFSGAGVTQNQVIRPTSDLGPTGGANVASQGGGAVDNWTQNPTTVAAGVIATNINNLLAIGIADADYTYDHIERPTVLRVVATWTAPHKFTMLESQFVVGNISLVNGTGQIMNLYVGANAGSAVAAGATVTLYFDGNTARAL